MKSALAVARGTLCNGSVRKALSLDVRTIRIANMPITAAPPDQTTGFVRFAVARLLSATPATVASRFLAALPGQTAITPRNCDWCPIGRLKRSLRKPPSETYRCGRCRRTFRHDARTVKAWRNGFRKFYCPECHAAWRCKKDAELFAWDQEYAGRSGCLGVILLCVSVVVLLVATN